MFRKLFKSLLTIFFIITVFGCGSDSKDGGNNDINQNSSANLVIDLGKNLDVINVLEEKKSVSLRFSSEFPRKDVVVNLPDSEIEINTSTTQQIKVPKDINYVVITDSQGKTIAITGTFTENIDLTPENIALSIVFMHTPFLKIERLTSESIANIRSDLMTLSSFNELVAQIRNQLLSDSYIDFSSLEPYVKSAVNDFISILITDKNIGYNIGYYSISISPSNEYHQDLMLEIQKGSFVDTNMYDKYGNRVYKGKVDVYNMGLLWQRLVIINPGVEATSVGGFVAPMMVSDFVGTFTSIEGLKKYFSDIINLNISNSKWDAKKTTLELLISCEYDTVCSYIGVDVFVVQYIDSVLKLASLVGNDKFNKFINYIVSKPDLINQLYIYIENKDYSSAISIIKKEFTKWAVGKISKFLISSIIDHLNFLKKNLKTLNMVQSQITKFLSLINISKDARYCWKFENIDCDKKDLSDNSYIVSDYSNITKGRVISDLNNTKLKIRIVPDINWIEGDYDGIVCDINGNGEWGNKCILYTSAEDFTKSDQCQIIIFEDRNDSWRFEKEENSAYGTNMPCSQLLGNYITIEVNNNSGSINGINCQSNPLGTYTYIESIELDSWQYIPNAVVVPNENTCWNNGENVTIQWDASKLSNGDKVDILILYDDPSGINDNNPDVCAIASKHWNIRFRNVDNTGYFMIDAEQLGGTGNAYKILIITNHGQWSMSKGTFSLNVCN